MKTLDKADKRFRILLAIAAVAVMLLVIGILLLGNYWMVVRHSGQDNQPPHPHAQGPHYNY